MSTPLEPITILEDTNEQTKPKKKRVRKAKKSEPEAAAPTIEPIERRAAFEFVETPHDTFGDPEESYSFADLDQDHSYYEPPTDWATRLKYAAGGALGGALVAFAGITYSLMIKEQREEEELAGAIAQRQKFIAQWEQASQNLQQQEASPTGAPAQP